MYLVVIVALLLSPQLALSAYQDPVIESMQDEGNGQVRLNVVFHGDAGEPDVRMPYIVRAGVNYRDIRVWAKEIIDDLDGVRTTTALATLQPGQTIPRVNRLAPSQTAKQIWNEKLRNYQRVKDAGITATETDLAAMKDNLESTYVSGYLAP